MRTQRELRQSLRNRHFNDWKWYQTWANSASLFLLTTPVGEYGDDLTGWTAVTIPLSSSGIVVIAPGATTDHVKVTLPVGSKVFARLKVTQ